MKKIIAVVLLLSLSLSLFGCHGILNIIKSTGMDTEEHTDTATETEIETNTDTEAAKFTAGQLYDMCKVAYEKTLSCNDASIKSVLNEVIYLTSGGRKQFIKLNAETDGKIKGISEKNAASEIHQIANTVINGEPKTEKTDMFFDADRIYCKETDDADYRLIDKNGEHPYILTRVFEKIAAADNDMAKQEFENAAVEDNADGTRSVSVTLDPERMKELTGKRAEEFISYFESLGCTDIDIEVKSISRVYTVSDKGELIREENAAEFNMTMKQGMSDAKASVTADSSVDFLNIGQSVEIEFPEIPDVYTLYNPFLSSPANKCELKLRKNGTFDIYCDMYSSNAVYNIRNIITEQGSYTYSDNKTRVTYIGRHFKLKTLFDSGTEKVLFRSSLKSLISMDPENRKLYEIILESMTDEGYEGTLEEWNELNKINYLGSSASDTGGEIILDKETMNAYVALSGITLEENQYYIVSEEMCLTLNDDGTCTMTGEYTDTEDNYGEYTMHYLETGAYEKSGLTVKCIIKSRNMKLSFGSEASAKAYKDEYNESYENGYISRVEYEYYMGLISEDGYTRETDETYTLTLEPHNQTAVINDYSGENG